MSALIEQVGIMEQIDKWRFPDKQESCIIQVIVYSTGDRGNLMVWLGHHITKPFMGLANK